MKIKKNIENMVKNAHSNYSSPTPKKWRKLGDALLGASTTITGFAIYEEAKWVAITALVLGTVGKFLTDFFTEK